MTNPKQKNTILLLIIIVICVFLFCTCCGAAFALWYLPFDPESPSATELGENPDFDTLFENEDWLYLFAEGNQIIVTDITGTYESIVLDIVEATHDTNAKLYASNFTISPDGNHLAFDYSTIRSSDNQSYSPQIVLILDLESREVYTISLELEDYKRDSTRPTYWLSPTVFLVKMHRFSDSDASTEEEAFLRFDLQDIDNPQVIAVGNCNLGVMQESPNALLQSCNGLNAKGHWELLAFDIDGIREPTQEEIAYHEQCKGLWLSEYECTKHLNTETAAMVETEAVTGNMVEGFGRWFKNNWNRQYIYLNGELVRVTDKSVIAKPLWDPDIHLFTWLDNCSTYQMDIEGHFRFWHTGDYIGKIPGQ